MRTVLFVVGAVVGLILAEARLSRRHERRLIAAGADVPPGDVYRALAVLYPTAILLMGAEGIWRAMALDARFGVAAGVPGQPAWFVSGVLMFAASKALKYWAIASLGERWTFRVVVLPDVPLVTRGPYRYVAHPNYVAVIGELLGTAMMVRAVVAGPVLIAAVALAIRARVRFEDRVLNRAAGVRDTS